MRVVPVFLCVLAVLAAGACGGGGTKEVNGCKIEPNTSCPGVDLTDEDLSDEDLSGADLSGATLVGTNLSDANLTEANLSNSRITNANLDDANLTRTNLTGATIDATSLTGATLCGTIRTNGTIDDTSCPASGGGGGGTTSTTTTTATTATTGTTSTGINPNLPEIVSLEGPSSVNCRGFDQRNVRLTWATRNADEVTWTVDGAAYNGPSQANGSGQFEFNCEQAQHKYTIRASNTKGEFATFSVTVQRVNVAPAPEPVQVPPPQDEPAG